jgi:hypothetical protein
MYTFILTKLCKQQAGVIQNHGNEHVRSRGKTKPRMENEKSLNLAAVTLTAVQEIKLPL